ncbi:MAG TPA: S8 family serine peptidase [Symbiobacteriaceae bacterium]|nr:S8 family serine peptidase [Symbiobacteriaceae bacterium]
MRKVFVLLIALLLIGAVVPQASAAPDNKTIGISVLLNTDISDAILAEIETHGKVRDVIPQIDALVMMAPAGELAAIRALPFVAAAGPEAERKGSPVDTVAVADFANGINTWDLDAVNATDYGVGRTAQFDGNGVYVAVLDTGLHDSWRKYFPEERIAVEYAKSFSGGPNESSNVSEQPNKWEHDQNGHGTHVTSTILGYQLGAGAVNGVAPMVKIIPVKVLGQSGSGTSGMVARGITYVADLKAGPLRDHPVVINMSLGGSVLDPVEQAALDYAIGKGVIIVAAAGNEGMAGMGYPAAYAPVISVAATGWVGEWMTPGSWWRTSDVADPINPDDFYVTDFSSRPYDKDLDVAAPGSWVVGPYQVNSGNTLSYYYLGGTSMATPHVAGIVALMLQKNPGMVQSQVESALEAAAIPLPGGCRSVTDPSVGPVQMCWETGDAGAGMITVDQALNATVAAP